MPSVAVFCGSRDGRRPGYARAADTVGRTLARRGVTVVYGGARIGLMGRVADAALAEGGEVVGVIPESLVARERAHRAATELLIVGSLHERKATMTERSDAFLTLPGGHGTLDELFEALTWKHLGVHRKPIGVWDVDGYWAPMVALLAHLEAEGFVSAPQQPVVDDDLERLLAALLP